MLARHHPDLGQESSLVSAFMRCCNRLIPTMTLEEKKIFKVKQQLAKMRRKESNYFTGRQMYAKQLVRLWDIMAEHGDAWSKLPWARQEHLEALAAQVRES